MILYHYTSIDTLLKIVDNIENDKICLRATHAKFFNDPHEYDLAISLLMSSMIKYEKQKSIKDKLSKNINKKLFSKIGQIFGNPFILSFSENQDDLTMWRSYGSDGKGVAIGFDKEMLLEYSDSKNTINTNLIKCKYEQKEIMDALVKYWDNFYDKISVSYDKKIGFNDFSFIFIMTHFSFSFKRYEYNLEKEWRLCKNDWDSNSVKFRESEGIIIPYVNHLLPKEIVKEIVVGPCSNKQLTKDSIILFLKMKNLKLTDSVYSSKVPYRKI